MGKCIECNINETDNIPAVCDACRQMRFPLKPVEPPKPSINIYEELEKMRDTLNRILILKV